MAITHFNFHLLILKVNPCRFSIFYCGCKQPKSVHILKLRAKVRFFVETSAVFLPKLLWHPLSISFFPIFANPKPQTTSSFINHRALRFCRSNPSSPFLHSPATVRFGFAEAIPHSPTTVRFGFAEAIPHAQPPFASVLPKQSLDSSAPFLWFH